MLGSSTPFMGSPFEHPRRSPRGALRALQIVVAIAAVTYLAQLLEWTQVRAAVRRADAGWVALAFLLQLPLLAGLILRWRVILRALGHDLPATLLGRWYLLFFLYSCVLPGTLGGDVVRGGACSQHTGPMHATTSILTERMCGMASVLLWGPLGVLFLTMKDRAIFGDELLFAICGIGGGVLVLGLCTLFVRTLRPSLPTIPTRWTRLQRVWSGLAEVLTLRTSALVRALGWSGAAQFADMLSMYALALGLGVPLNFAVLVVLVPVTYVVTLLPISLGGLGIREGVTVFFLSHAGVSVSDATLLALLVFSTKAFLGVLGGMTQLASPSKRSGGAHPRRDSTPVYSEAATTPERSRGCRVRRHASA